MGKLDSKVAIVIGAGQNEGEAMGNGRATALRFLEEGASVLAVDRNIDSAQATIDMAKNADARAFRADVRDGDTLHAAVSAAIQHWGRVDILHYNVGVNIRGGDQPLEEITEDIFDQVNAINLRGFIMAAKHVEPVMRTQKAGVLLGVSSICAFDTSTPYVAYRTSKAGMNAFTQQFAIRNAEFGIRANTIMPGRIDTATAVDNKLRLSGMSRQDFIAERAALTPLQGHHPTGYDVANAAVFLASDEAAFITGASLPVDGGALAKIGW